MPCRVTTDGGAKLRRIPRAFRTVGRDQKHVSISHLSWTNVTSYKVIRGVLSTTPVPQPISRRRIDVDGVGQADYGG